MSSVNIKRKNGDIISLTEVTRYSKDFQNTVTSNPIENGSKISDHIQSENARFTINGYVSWVDITKRTGVIPAKDVKSQNKDVTILGETPATLVGGSYVYKALKEVRDRKELVDILENYRKNTPLYAEDGVLGLTLHKNCIMTSLSFDEDSETGDGANVTMTFEQIRLVTLREVVVKVPVQSTGNGDKGENKGSSKVDGKPSTNPVAQASTEKPKGEIATAVDNIGALKDKATTAIRGIFKPSSPSTVYSK